MKYITLNDLNKTIRDNIWKIPRDIDCIVAIPRSGTICASIISEFLNVPLIDIDAFAAGVEPYGGGRLRYFHQKHENKEKRKVLVVDDTVYSGKSKIEARQKLDKFKDCEFIFMVVYLEGPGDWSIDLYLEDLRGYTNNFTEIVYYEWNIFHHNEDVMASCLYDLDGVMCVEPPDERNTEAYENYIKNATPLFVPTAKVGGIVTYRLVKYYKETEKWLADNKIDYGFISMFNAQSWDERNNTGVSPMQMKSEIYGRLPQFRLFVESSVVQAEAIYKATGKPVLCVENNKLYGGA